MIIVLYLFFILIVLLVIITVVWRLGSQRYTLPCPVWMKWLLDPPGFKRMSGRTRKTIELLDIAPGMNVLDAGCGPGRLSIPIAKIIGPDNGIVTAMDIQEGMLDDVRMRAKKENISNINYIHGGIGEKQLPFNHYDRAVMITVIGEIPGREMAMKDIFNAMKPGGILLVEETIRDPHFQTRSAVLKLTGDHGFIEKGFFGNRFSYTLLLEKPIDI